MRVDRLKAIRKERELSQEELALRAEISIRQLLRYESGESDPTADVIMRMAKELGVSTDWLLGLVEDPNAHRSEEDLTPDEHKLLSAWRREDTHAILELLVKIGKNPKEQSGISGS